MAYYDKDTSYYSYSVPTHYDNTPVQLSYQDYSPSYDSYNPQDPSYSLYHNDATSVSYNDYQPLELTHWHLDPSYTNGVSLYDDDTISDEFHDDVPVFEDEIHPAYRDYPTLSVSDNSTWLI